MTHEYVKSETRLFRKRLYLGSFNASVTHREKERDRERTQRCFPRTRRQIKALIVTTDWSVDGNGDGTGALGSYLRLVFTANLKALVSIRENGITGRIFRICYAIALELNKAGREFDEGKKQEFPSPMGPLFCLLRVRSRLNIRRICFRGRRGKE